MLLPLKIESWKEFSIHYLQVAELMMKVNSLQGKKNIPLKNTSLASGVACGKHVSILVLH